jgi:hypothetical protein
MADSNAESIQELRNIILADVHLTQRILGIANSAGYRLNSGAGITTVTRAIVVIGFEQVKLLALGMLFVSQAGQLEIDIDSPGDLFAAAIHRGSDLQIRNEIACILVGRDLPEPEPISPEDMRLLRTVRGQIILAMKTVR